MKKHLCYLIAATVTLAGLLPGGLASSSPFSIRAEPTPDVITSATDNASFEWLPEASMPSADPDMNQLVPGSDVTDLAVASDNTTIYAVDSPNNRVYKSTNQGTNWSRLASVNITEIPQLVAVAPDDANILLIADNTANVSLSVDGGASFNRFDYTSSGWPFTLATVNAIAISPVVNDTSEGNARYIAIAGIRGSDGTADIQYFTVDSNGRWMALRSMRSSGSGWYQGPFTGLSNALAIAFSPNFLSDETMVAVTSNGASSLSEIASFTSQQWNSNAGFNTYPKVVSDTLATSASIALTPTYLASDETLRVSFVGLATGNGMGGLFRLRDDGTDPTALINNTDVASVAYNGSSLVAGLYTGNNVYSSPNPLADAPTPYYTSLYQRPGGTNKVQVAWAGSHVVAGTSGTSSAFSVSKDNGVTFNDVGLIDTILTNLRDVAVSGDGNTVYLVSDDNPAGANITSLWRRSSGVWERVLNIWGLNGHFSSDYILRVAPDNASNVYLADTAGDTMLSSNDSAEQKWMLRVLVKTPADIAIESAHTVYALTPDGAVYKSTNAGFTWEEGTATGLATGATITSVIQNVLAVGGADGSVAWSTNGGANWTAKTGNDAPFTSGKVQVAADKPDSGGYVYAATSMNGQHIKRWQITSGASWGDLGGNLTGGATGLVLWGSGLYALTDVTGDGLSRIYLTSNPMTANSTIAWDTCNTTAVFNRTPQALKVSSGKLWAIDNDATDLLYSRDRLPDASVLVPGDANDDGIVDALDITKIERIIAHMDSPTPGANVNQDGAINALDITRIERLIAGLD